jgi:hypothetical protein
MDLSRNMKSPNSLLVLALVAAPWLVAGCGQGDVQAGKPAAQAATAEPTRERLEARVGERLKSVEARDLAAVHNYFSPAMKKQRTLGQFAQQMENHKYESCRMVEILATNQDMGYVRTGALWTPTHPQVQRVKLEPGQTLTQDIEIIETWQWVENDWHFVRQESESDFFEANPDLLKKK